MATLQRRLQAVSIAFLRPVLAGKRSFLLRALLPSEDRVALDESVDHRQLHRLLLDMGRVVAWGQLRSAGRQGSANADELIDFGLRRSKWQDGLLEVAHDCAQQTRRDWQTYVDAFDEGAFA